MYKSLLERFEIALRRRNPKLAQSLQPGMPEAHVRRNLKRVKVEGAIGPIIDLFSWRDGTRPDAGLLMEQASLFPRDPYIFLELDMMLGHFSGFEECAKYHPKLGEVVGRYFPIFWDGSNRYLAVDLDPSRPSRVVLVDAQSEKPIVQAYHSFGEFLDDAIRANEKNDKLTCFNQKNQRE